MTIKSKSTPKSRYRFADPPTDGVHDWLFKEALKATKSGVPASVIFATLRKLSRKTRPGRRVNDSEIRESIGNAVKYALMGKRNRANYKPKPKIALNPDAVERFIDPTFTEDALKAHSGEVVSCKDILNTLFKPDELVCLGLNQFKATTKPFSEWVKKDLTKYQFIVPNPMRARAGINNDGQESARCNNNAVHPDRRRFIVFEIDGIPDRDKQSAILWRIHETGGLPLVVVVSSGGKSLHGWFLCSGYTDSTLEPWKRRAAILGADTAAFRPCQFVRLPGGTRDGGNPQGVIYFNPEALR